jgi:L-threonylcarbamoyladenylate synthase
MPRFDCSDPEERARGIDLAVASAGRHQLVVFATDVAYGVACDAFSSVAVERLNEAKERFGDAALPVMVGSIRAAKALMASLSPEAERIVDGFWPGPLTVVAPQQTTLRWDLGGDGDTVTIRMPLHPVALEVLNRVGPMAVVSANTPGGAVPRECASAEEQLADAVAVYLDAGLCPSSDPSTVIDVTVNPPRLLREGAISKEQLLTVTPELWSPESVRPEAEGESDS